MQSPNRTILITCYAYKLAKLQCCWTHKCTFRISPFRHHHRRPSPNDGTAQTTNIIFQTSKWNSANFEANETYGIANEKMLTAKMKTQTKKRIWNTTTTITTKERMHTNNCASDAKIQNGFFARSFLFSDLVVFRLDGCCIACATSFGAVHRWALFTLLLMGHLPA